MLRNELVEYLDEYLKVNEVEDVSQNGLQVQGPADVRKVAVAVDAHPEVGNNVELARLLQLKNVAPFRMCYGVIIGMAGELVPALSVSAMAERLEEALRASTTRVFA
jgi:putative NIF3 family GTP cyclohydrolase 1 type 2